jgi:hypothetical protein
LHSGPLAEHEDAAYALVEVPRHEWTPLLWSPATFDASSSSPSPAPADVAAALRRCLVFADLWARGFHVSAARKFGADFLVYPGAQADHHSMFMVTVRAWGGNRVDDVGGPAGSVKPHSHSSSGDTVDDSDDVADAPTALELAALTRLAVTVRKIRPLMGSGYPLTPTAAQDKREGPGVPPEAFATRFRSCPMRA